jgi:hypothetical protein
MPACETIHKILFRINVVGLAVAVVCLSFYFKGTIECCGLSKGLLSKLLRFYLVTGFFILSVYNNKSCDCQKVL